MRTLALILFVGLLCGNALASEVVLTDGDGVVDGYLSSANTPDYSNGINLINPDISAVRAVRSKYWKIVSGSVVEMTVAEKNAVDASELASMIAARDFVQAIKTSDQTNVGTSFADISGVGISIAENTTYSFEFTIIADSDATTTGIDVSVSGPASPVSIAYEVAYWTSANARTERCFTAYDGNTASTSSNGTAQKIYKISGVLINGANAGTLNARAKREAVGAGPNIRSGSYGILRKLS